jgi:hypothetical protein
MITGHSFEQLMGREIKPGQFVEAPVDIINSPPHYTAGGIETIDFMKAKATREEFHGYLRLTVLKYLSRGPYKSDALEDYKKARWFLNRLIEELDNERK